MTPTEDDTQETGRPYRSTDPKLELASFLQRVLDVRMISLAELRRRLSVDRKTPGSWLKGKKWPSQENQMALAKALGVPVDCFRQLDAGASAHEVLVEAFPELRRTPIREHQHPEDDEDCDELSWADADLETRQLLAEAFPGDPSAADAARLTLAAISWALRLQRRKALTKAELWKEARDATRDATRHGYIDLVAMLQESGVLVENQQRVTFANPQIRDVACVDWLLLNHTIEEYPMWIFQGSASWRLKRFLVQAQGSKKKVLRLLARRPSLFSAAAEGRLGPQVRDFLLTELEHAVSQAESFFDELEYHPDRGALHWSGLFGPTKGDPRWKLLGQLPGSYDDTLFPFCRRLIEAAERGCEKAGVPMEAVPKLVAELSESPLHGRSLNWWFPGEVGKEAHQALVANRSVGPLSTTMWARLTDSLWGPLDWDDDEDIRPEIGRTEKLPSGLLDELREEARSLNASEIEEYIDHLLYKVECAN
jgi:transcriptional regulator with XRE-family HTH domain